MIITRHRKVPGPQYSVADYVRKQLGQRGAPVGNPLERLKRTKVFLRARLSGAGTVEAKRLSSLPGNASQIMNSPVTKAILEELCKEEQFRDPGLVKRLKEMWHHKRVKQVEVIGATLQKKVSIEEDDTDMWKYSMDKVLELRGYTKHSKEGDTTNVLEATGGITFNVLQIPQ